MPDQLVIPAELYAARQQSFTNKAQALSVRLQWMSLLRLLIFVGIIYMVYRSLVSEESIYVVGGILFLLAFFGMIRFYDRLQQRVRFYKALARINDDEKQFVQGLPVSFDQGTDFIDPHHPYSYDLDLFGAGGMYPSLNRCSSRFGREALAKDLLQPDTTHIASRQEAILELRDQINFRQELQAQGSLLETSEKGLDQLQQWLQAPAVFPHAWQYRLLFLFPLASFSCLFYYLFTEQEQALNLFYWGFTLNLFVAFAFGKKIARQLSLSQSVTTVLTQFAGQFRQIETLPVQSEQLARLKAGLSSEDIVASRSIARLSSLFNYLESIVNLAVSLLLNGLFLFHVHILYGLDRWKKQHGGRVYNWLRLLGEMESLSSFANLAFNNPSFCQPELLTEPTWEATDLGHPLIAEHKRIPNSVSFRDNRFVILTGSNMSGKSTFLRTIGINLVLARAGSVVCAANYRFYPFAIRVSMRITDSLQDSESFFYAELKRLQSIIAQLEAGEPTFILLDEILRGTNSHDKHTGTVGLIRKLIAEKAVGIIATHDLAVAELEAQYNGYVRNYCFESNIVNDELLFDYRLKPGVCSKLSASFLMKKMGIIDEKTAG